MIELKQLCRKQWAKIYSPQNFAIFSINIFLQEKQESKQLLSCKGPNNRKWFYGFKCPQRKKDTAKDQVKWKNNNLDIHLATENSSSSVLSCKDWNNNNLGLSIKSVFVHRLWRETYKKRKWIKSNLIPALIHCSSNSLQSLMANILFYETKPTWLHWATGLFAPQEHVGTVGSPHMNLAVILAEIPERSHANFFIFVRQN